MVTLLSFTCSNLFVLTCFAWCLFNFLLFYFATVPVQFYFFFFYLLGALFQIFPQNCQNARTALDARFRHDFETASHRSFFISTLLSLQYCCKVISVFISILFSRQTALLLLNLWQLLPIVVIITKNRTFFSKYCSTYVMCYL